MKAKPAQEANTARRRARPARRWWRPEDHPIRRKLWSILAIPMALLVVLAGLVVASSAQEAVDARRLVALARLSQASGELAGWLSQERASAALALLGQPAGLGQSARIVDEAVAAWREVADKIAGIDQTEAVTRAEVLLEGLPDLRIEVTDGQLHTAFSVVLLRYQLVIAALLEVRQGFIVAGAPAQTAERIRASVALSQAAEATGLLQAGVARATAMGPLSPATAAQIASARVGYTQALRDWDAAALPQWRAHLDQALSGEQLLAAQRLDGVVSRTKVGDRFSLPRDQWMQAQSNRQERLRQVIDAADSDIVVMLEAWGRQRTLIAAATGAGTAAALLLSLLLASFVARRTVRSLVRLRDQATSVADTGLPAAVAALSAEPFAGDLDGRRAAARNGVMLAAIGADEVAAVTSSFNAVARTALDQAIALVRSRDQIVRLIVDLGRRQQVLIDALLVSIDKAERQEADATRLERLFAVDHLASRMWRANRNLLLLGGVPAAVTRSEPESLANVLTAATSYVEGYQRTVLTYADDVLIRPAAVTPVVQALAELIDNALVYSSATVEVSGRRVGDRVVVEVADSGIGMTPQDQLAGNDLLSGRVPAEPGVRHMGLQVVARVAAEQGLAVILYARSGQGMTAEMTLPWSVLQPFSHRRADAPTEIVPPRLMDRMTGGSSWPPARPTAAATVIATATAAMTGAGLPVRQRDRTAAPGPAQAVVISPRDRETRARALSAIQRGQQASRVGRPTTAFTQGEKS